MRGTYTILIIGYLRQKRSYQVKKQLQYLKQGFGDYGVDFKYKNSRKLIFTPIVMKLKIKGYPSARIPFSL